jgi:hypothetical protein
MPSVACISSRGRVGLSALAQTQRLRMNGLMMCYNVLGFRLPNMMICRFQCGFLEVWMLNLFSISNQAAVATSDSHSNMDQFSLLVLMIYLKLKRKNHRLFTIWLFRCCHRSSLQSSRSMQSGPQRDGIKIHHSPIRRLKEWTKLSMPGKA